jgi:hypothetical protein
MVTDVPRKAANAPPARPLIDAAKERLPADANVINAIVSQTETETVDASAGGSAMFSATWFNQRGTTAGRFSVTGDTLTGTTRLSAGDVAYPMQLFRARRAGCPP